MILETQMLLRAASFAAMLAVSGVLHAEQHAKPVLEMTADGEVQIGIDGHVSDYRIKNKLTPELDALIEKSVRGWRFEPVVIEGAAVVAKTALHLTLKAEPRSEPDQYSVKIVNVRFGEPQRGKRQRPPHYPEAAAMSGVGAKVILSVRLDETGQVVEVLPYQTSLDHRPSSELEALRLRELFEKSSVTAAKTWHFDLSETINGKPIGTSAMVPIVYFLKGNGVHTPTPGEWTPYLPGPVHPAPWAHAATNPGAEDLAALGDGQALSLDSHFRLKDNVIGKTL
jgi:hypothetical protein